MVALDPATGDEVWRLGGSGDAVVAPSPYGTVLDLDGGLTVVTTDGAVAFEADEDSLVGERWDTFVARSASGPVLVDPEGGAALGADGPTSLLGEEVVQLLGPGPAGLIWAVGYVDGDGEVVLIDGDGTVAASSGLLLLRDPDDPLPHLFIQAASGQAVVATVSGA